MTNIEYAAGLRELADFYETHPAMPQAHNPLRVYIYGRENFIRAALELSSGGKITKSADKPTEIYPYYHAKRMFGGVGLDVVINRNQVCRLVSPAVYDCPDSLIAEAAEYTAI